MRPVAAAGLRQLAFVPLALLGMAFCRSARATDGSWSLILPDSPGPSPRYVASMVFDSVTDQAIVFGGQDAVSLDPLNDVWLLRLSGRAPRTGAD
jgi:hypothetical protein